MDCLLRGVLLKSPKISIVTISYNQLDYLERNVASIFGQDFQDFEQIIVDPGSTDGSREYLQALSDDRVVLLLNPDNGPADGLNKGFARARGDIILYLNSDDELAPGALSRIAEVHDSRRDVDVVIGNGWTIDEDGKPLRFIVSDSFTPIRHALAVGTVLQQATSFKRRIFASGLTFNGENPVNWDAEILYDAYERGARFLRVNYPLGYFRLHGESITMGGRHGELIRTETERLQRRAIPYLPISVVRVLGRLARLAKFALRFPDRTLRSPLFPGLVEAAE